MRSTVQRARVRCEPGTDTTSKIPPELLTERIEVLAAVLVGSDGFVVRYNDAVMLVAGRVALLR